MADVSPFGVNFNNGQAKNAQLSDTLVDDAGNAIDALIGVQGFTGLQGVTGIAGIIGTTGVSVQGFTGLQGETGIVGIPGATGIQAITGIHGITGAAPQGETGIFGTTGLIGNTGIFGQPGINGAQGNTGLIGGTGIAGTAGITGLTGQGLYGETGFQGAPGIIGPTGINGITGTGLIGATGFQGNTGILGATGINGLQILSAQRQPFGGGATLLLAVPSSTLNSNNQYLEFSSAIQTPTNGSPATLNVTFGGQTLFSQSLTGVTNGLFGFLRGNILRTGASAEDAIIDVIYSSGASSANKSSATASLGSTQILGINLSTSDPSDDQTVLNLTVYKVLGA